MLYKSLWITEDEKNQLKDLIFQNHPKIYNQIHFFEEKYNLIQIKDNVISILKEVQENPNENFQEENKLEKIEIKSEKNTGKIIWREKDGILYRIVENIDSPPVKIAGFSLDDCLIKTKSNLRKSVNWDDWTWLFPPSFSIFNLVSLFNSGYTIVLFVNAPYILHKSFVSSPFSLSFYFSFPFSSSLPSPSLIQYFPLFSFSIYDSMEATSFPSFPLPLLIQ